MAKRDYEVGFGKPPKATRFKKGASGNPKGRPKGSKNLAAALEEVLAEKISVTVGKSRQRKVAKGEAVVMQLVNRALTGDMKAVALLLGQVRAKDAEAERQPPSGALGNTAEDQEVIAGLIERLNQTDEKGGDQ